MLELERMLGSPKPEKVTNKKLKSILLPETKHISTGNI
jgi:hypothetical protein